MSLDRCPTLDELAAHPQRANDLTPQLAAELLAKLVALLPLLLIKALNAPPNGGGDLQAPALADHLLTIEQVAQRINVSNGRAYELARRGDLPTIRKGRRYVRVEPAALEAWIAHHRKNGVEEAGYVTYHRIDDDRRRTSAASKPARPDAGTAGPKGRRHPQFHRPAGAGRNRDKGTAGQADPAPGGNGAEGNA